MIDGDFKCLIFLPCWRTFYIWIKGAINLFWQMKLCSTTLFPLPFYWDLTWKRKKADEEMMMNHSSCGTAQIRHDLHFHAIIRLSWCFQITFRTTLILSPQTPAWVESNHENGNSSGSFSLAFLDLEWHLAYNILGLRGHFGDFIIQPLSVTGCKAYGMKWADLLSLVQIKIWNIIFSCDVPTVMRVLEKNCCLVRAESSQSINAKGKSVSLPFTMIIGMIMYFNLFKHQPLQKKAWICCRRELVK